MLLRQARWSMDMYVRVSLGKPESTVVALPLYREEQHHMVDSSERSLLTCRLPGSASSNYIFFKERCDRFPDLPRILLTTGCPDLRNGLFDKPTIPKAKQTTQEKAPQPETWTREHG